MAPSSELTDFLTNSSPSKTFHPTYDFFPARALRGRCTGLGLGAGEARSSSARCRFSVPFLKQWRQLLSLTLMPEDAGHFVIQKNQ
jgi:hypothetical protein